MYFRQKNIRTKVFYGGVNYALCIMNYELCIMNYALNLTTSPLRGTPPKNYSVIFKRRVTALIGYIVPTKILAESQEESFRYSGCKDTMQKSEKVAIMKKNNGYRCR